MSDLCVTLPILYTLFYLAIFFPMILDLLHRLWSWIRKRVGLWFSWSDTGVSLNFFLDFYAGRVLLEVQLGHRDRPAKKGV